MPLLQSATTSCDQTATEGLYCILFETGTAWVGSFTTDYPGSYSRLFTGKPDSLNVTSTALGLTVNLVVVAAVVAVVDTGEGGGPGY